MDTEGSHDEEPEHLEGGGPEKDHGIVLNHPGWQPCVMSVCILRTWRMRYTGEWTWYSSLFNDVWLASLSTFLCCQAEWAKINTKIPVYEQLEHLGFQTHAKEILLDYSDGLEEANDLEHPKDLDDAQDPVVAVVLNNTSLKFACLQTDRKSTRLSSSAQLRCDDYGHGVKQNSLNILKSLIKDQKRHSGDKILWETLNGAYFEEEYELQWARPNRQMPLNLSWSRW